MQSVTQLVQKAWSVWESASSVLNILKSGGYPLGKITKFYSSRCGMAPYPSLMRQSGEESSNGSSGRLCSDDSGDDSDFGGGSARHKAGLPSAVTPAAYSPISAFRRGDAQLGGNAAAASPHTPPQHDSGGWPASNFADQRCASFTARA